MEDFSPTEATGSHAWAGCALRQYIENNRGEFDFFYLIVKCLNGYSNPK